MKQGTMALSQAQALALMTSTLPVSFEEMQAALGPAVPAPEERRSRLKPATGFGQSKKRRGKRKTLEEEFAKEIKAGIIKIVRHRGKPPEIIWL